MTMLEALEHMFFMILILGIEGVLVWWAWVSEDPIVILLAVIAYIVVSKSMRKERRYLTARLSEDDDPKQ